eukprot:Skav221168  [mRNA]  locus=scaffold85:430199:430423:+ [translate_table: standard]
MKLTKPLFCHHESFLTTQGADPRARVNRTRLSGARLEALSLLHVADNLERAIDSVKTDQLDESEAPTDRQNNEW